MTTAIPAFLRDSLENYRATACGITLDFGRQRLTRDEFESLCQLAKDRGVIEHLAEQCAGAIVNPSEGRAALHTALRDYRPEAPYYEQTRGALNRMIEFANGIRSGRLRGCRGDRFTDIVNVGIGGSEMGPRAVYHALRNNNPTLRAHFVAAADGVMFDRVMSELDPFKTLVIVSSKSFKTRETAVNATAIDQWLLEAGIAGVDREKHMVLVSANPEAAQEMNLPEDNLFPMWNWVGGRFSVWSAVGLVDIITLGSDAFKAFLVGAHDMDVHARTAPITQNLPAILALLSYWNSREHKIALHCCLPYDERLRVMVPWQQQLEMESLGKCVSLDGTIITQPTGQGIWGGHGNESQHSFYQWLREGTANCSIDLLWCEYPGHNHAEMHRVLIANAKAQAEALVTRDNPHYFNAVSTLSIDVLNPARLGALMALYEHKTTMLGTLFNINPFDQPGVEFAKRLARKVEADIT